MGTQIPFSLLFQGPPISIPVVHILFQEKRYETDHMQESQFQSLSFIRKILFQSPGIRDKTPGPHDHNDCADTPWHSAFLIPGFLHSFRQFIIASILQIRKNFQSWMFQRNGDQISC